RSGEREWTCGVPKRLHPGASRSAEIGLTHCGQQGLRRFGPLRGYFRRICETHILEQFAPGLPPWFKERSKISSDRTPPALVSINWQDRLRPHPPPYLPAPGLLGLPTLQLSPP